MQSAAIHPSFTASHIPDMPVLVEAGIINVRISIPATHNIKVPIKLVIPATMARCPDSFKSMPHSPPAPLRFDDVTLFS